MKRIRTLTVAGLIVFSLYVAVSTGLTIYTKSGNPTPSDDFVSKWQKRVLRTLNHIPADVVSIGM